VGADRDGGFVDILDWLFQKRLELGSSLMPRPREFDIDDALDRALGLLWTKGYEATSLDDLCATTGLSRSSFYATFGSKRSLLLRSVDRYVEQRNARLAESLMQPIPVRSAFAALLAEFIDQIVSGAGRKGCFLGNCAAEIPRNDREAHARVRKGLARNEATFRAALVRGRDSGELSVDADVDALARFFVAAFQGLRLIGKSNPDRAVLEDVAATMLLCLDRSGRSRAAGARRKTGSERKNAKAPLVTRH
jgi:TetR/AcrR family transcriptional repressor of nem operon